ncbi:MAG TPA: phosphoribosyltransferase family protein [Candidatus Omnitrophota bacterium]|nr:phosphoribosyltransferase family protein [Candidatus Omnitrophota bacterium]
MILSAFEALLASVFPSECQDCGQALTPPQNKLCQGCYAHLAEYELAWEDAWYPSPIQGIRSAWSALRYRGPVKDYLQRIKFKHEFYLLEALTQRTSKLFEAVTSETDYHAMIPMPIDFPGRWNRRFNQTEVIASYLCRAKKVPICANTIYKRWGFRPQHGLNKEERKWNLFGAFGVKSARAVRGKTFLLIDDIVTTGATASEAARLLLNHGAKQVDLFTLARSEKQIR